jgi:hypothetical protein
MQHVSDESLAASLVGEPTGDKLGICLRRVCVE